MKASEWIEKGKNLGDRRCAQTDKHTHTRLSRERVLTTSRRKANKNGGKNYRDVILVEFFVLVFSALSVGFFLVVLESLSFYELNCWCEGHKMLTILMQNALEADLLLIFSTYFIFSTMFAFNCAHLQLHTHTHKSFAFLF